MANRLGQLRAYARQLIVTPVVRHSIPTGQCGIRYRYSKLRVPNGEERFLTLGLLLGRLVTIAHAPRGEATRTISMRKANRREQKIYQERRGTA
jgi:hypothetical protein